ncbi:hypothetical protein F4804DRAFT_287474 [Jackrogersella minutella]|nr:hypothetical protein F4804DRAFT_287474 [Jackrogersella minutella]
MANRGVPRTAEVIPGAAVNIVLKPDQRTGREVSGTVRDVLTRGDHHRGIKVRLTDGRIGRVQSIASASPASSSSSDSAALIRSHTALEHDAVDSNDNTVSHPRGHRPRYRDVRLDEPLDAPAEHIDLGAYIVPAKRKGKGKNKNGQKESDQPDGPARSDDVSGTNELNAALDVSSPTATCPVCGVFEGDEMAVAHHVAEHFE